MASSAVNGTAAIFVAATAAEDNCSAVLKERGGRTAKEGQGLRQKERKAEEQKGDQQKKKRATSENMSASMQGGSEPKATSDNECNARRDGRSVAENKVPNVSDHIDLVDRATH